jgi:hypothetical protein
MQTPVTRHAVPSTQAALWQCGACNSFIGIQSQHPVMEPLCPVCGSPTLELCAPLPNIFGCECGEA